MSAPAEKLSPSPASNTARASPTSAKASASSAIRPASTALRFSGRASVTRSRRPSRTTRSAAMSRSLERRVSLLGVDRRVRGRRRRCQHRVPPGPSRRPRGGAVRSRRDRGRGNRQGVRRRSPAVLERRGGAARQGERAVLRGPRRAALPPGRLPVSRPHGGGPCGARGAAPRPGGAGRERGAGDRRGRGRTLSGRVYRGRARRRLRDRPTGSPILRP